MLEEGEYLLLRIAQVLGQDDTSRIAMFEHGCCRDAGAIVSARRLAMMRAGACTDHAHMHLVAGVDYGKLEARMRLLGASRPIQGLAQLGESVGMEQAYVVVGNPKEGSVRWRVHAVEQVPSQFMRQIVAAQLEYEFWDWRVYPHVNKVTQAVQRLGESLRGALRGHGSNDEPGSGGIGQAIGAREAE